LVSVSLEASVEAVWWSAGCLTSIIYSSLWHAAFYQLKVLCSSIGLQPTLQVWMGLIHPAGIPNFFWSRPSTFLALKVQLVVLVSVFVMLSTVWPVSGLLFFYSRYSRAQPFVKVGARAPRAQWSRRHCYTVLASHHVKLMLTQTYSMPIMSCLCAEFWGTISIMTNQMCRPTRGDT